jgi:hypothetical protein
MKDNDRAAGYSYECCAGEKASNVDISAHKTAEWLCAPSLPIIGLADSDKLLIVDAEDAEVKHTTCTKQDKWISSNLKCTMATLVKALAKSGYSRRSAVEAVQRVQAKIAAAFVRAGSFTSKGPREYVKYKNVSEKDRTVYGLPNPYVEEECTKVVTRFAQRAITHICTTPPPADFASWVAVVKHLLGNAEWNCGDMAGAWGLINRSEAMVALDTVVVGRFCVIAAEAESKVYVPLKLGAQLGKLGESVPKRPHHVRMDENDVLGKGFWSFVKEATDDDEDMYYIAGLLYLAALFDGDFQKEATVMVKKHGGTLRVAAPKSMERMEEKLYGDRDEEATPKGAANVDIVRNCAVFPDAASMSACLSEFTKRFPTLRMKNNYRPAFDAVKESFGYRSILCNMLYTTPTNLTWAQLAGRYEADREWSAVNARLGMSYGKMMLKKVSAPIVEKLGSSSWAQRPVRFVVETQFVLEPYMDMRKQSHLLYKIHRSETSYSLQRAFSESARVTGADATTPLHDAAKKGHLDTVQFFVDNGANVNAATNVSIFA